MIEVRNGDMQTGEEPTAISAETGPSNLQQRHRTPLDRSQMEIGALALLAIAFVIYAAVFIWQTSFDYQGQRYFTLFDDEMIGMKYARNVARGLGLVWNPGDKVEGFTNPLWVGYMVLLHLLPVPESKISLLVQLTGMCLQLVAAWFIYRIGRIIAGGAFVPGFFAAVLTLFYYPLANWALQGWETSRAPGDVSGTGTGDFLAGSFQVGLRLEPYPV